MTNNMFNYSAYKRGYTKALLDLLEIFEGDFFRGHSKKKNFELVIKDCLKYREHLIDGKTPLIKTKENEKGNFEIVGIGFEK